MRRPTGSPLSREDRCEDQLVLPLSREDRCEEQLVLPPSREDRCEVSKVELERQLVLPARREDRFVNSAGGLEPSPSLRRLSPPRSPVFLGPSDAAPIRSYMEAAVDFHGVTACAEFPNDNPALHEGALWVVREIGEGAACERRILETIEEARGMVAEAPVAEVAAAVAVVEEPLVATEPPTDPAPPVVEAEDEDDDIEIVEELSFEGAIDESPAAPQAPSADAFALFVAAIEDVARAAGAKDDAMATIAALVGRARLDASASEEHKTLRAQALAWQGILRGESEDFSACGSGMLDEWAAGLVAFVLGNAQRADGLENSAGAVSQRSASSNRPRNSASTVLEPRALAR